ncbi:MAG: hypothetical protein ACJ8EI_07290 [Sphingomicrobium sp.]
MTPAGIGLPDLEPGRPYGVVMEFDVDGDTATLAAFGNGDCSIYFSFGGGTIGGGQHESSAAAAKRLVRLSEAYLPRLSRAIEQPRPGPGDVNFYVLTTDGTFGVTRPEKGLTVGTDEFSELYSAGHDVITQLRLIQDRMQAR